MKYPNTPDYLENAPNYIVQLWRDLEEFTIQDICRRLKLSGEMTNSAVEQIRALKRLGYDQAEVEKKIREALTLSEEEFNGLFDRAIERNQQYFDHVIGKADLTREAYSAAAMERQIEAIRRQTLDELRNLTQSMGFAVRTARGVEFMPVAETYQKILDDAELQVLTGVVDYNTAIRGAVKRLTDGGLQWVDYASGWHNRADVAARRAVMTGVTQLAAKYSEQTMELLDTDLVEVTAHGGARDKGKGYENHKSWQGKVYSMSGKNRRYPSLRAVTGYGEGGGLCGWNCRHSFFAYIEGVSERAYTDEQLANIDPPPFEYQGRTYTAFEATQKQRQIETAIRACKRTLAGYEAAGLEDDHRTAAGRLRRLRQEYKGFSRAAGLRMQPERHQVQGFGQKQASRASAAAKAVEKQAAAAYNKKQEDIRALIRSDKTAKSVNAGHQNKHIKPSKGYIQGRSYIYGDLETVQSLVDRHHGTGEAIFSRKGEWSKKEVILCNEAIGVNIDPETGVETETRRFTIHYGKNGAHIVPTKEKKNDLQ